MVNIIWLARWSNPAFVLQIFERLVCLVVFVHQILPAGCRGILGTIILRAEMLETHHLVVKKWKKVERERVEMEHSRFLDRCGDKYRGGDRDRETTQRKKQPRAFLEIPRSKQFQISENKNMTM